MNKLLEKFSSKDILIISFIFICLMIAFAPSYLFDYFRHDDWASACWDRVAIYTHHLFGNSVLNEFRPYTMIFIYYAELFTEYLSGAKIVKIASIVILSFSSFLLYKWLRIFNVNNLWALFLSVLLFLLPPMQIMSSTYQYFFMVVPVLLCSITFFIIWDIQNKNYTNIGLVFKFILFIQLITFLTLYPLFILYSILVSAFMLFLYYRYNKVVAAKTPLITAAMVAVITLIKKLLIILRYVPILKYFVSKNKQKNDGVSKKESSDILNVNVSEKRAEYFLYISAFVIYFTAVTAYPMSAMYIWFLLGVTLLMLFKSDDQKKIVDFSIKVFVFSATTMIIYFILGRFFAFILGIDTNHARGMSISGDIGKIFFHTLDAFRISSNLWDIKEYFVTGKFFSDYDTLIIIFSTFVLSLFVVKRPANYKHSLLVFLSVSSLVFFTIAPLVLSNNGASMYRYLIALTPLVGFIFLWSLSVLYSYIPKIKYERYFLITVLGSFFIGMIYMSNHTLFKNVVEPNLHEMNYMSNILDRVIIPKIKNNEKVVIHHVQGKVNYTRGRYSLDEYNVSMNIFKWPVLPSIVMHLKDKGINTLSRTCMPSKWEADHGIFELNWGMLEMFTTMKSQKENSLKDEDILINMGDLDFID